MKPFFLYLALLAPLASESATVCGNIRDNKSAVETLRTGKVLTAENWRSLDVIASFNFRECSKAFTQEVIRVDGELYWRFKSNEDRCDGGNSYGAIYSYDLKTPIAHIYDSDVTCKEDWRDDYLAENYRCNAAAEKLAAEKLKALKLDIENLWSSIEVRKGYIYSYINVTGTIKNLKDEPISIRVLANLKKCDFGNVTITDLNL